MIIIVLVFKGMVLLSASVPPGTWGVFCKCSRAEMCITLKEPSSKLSNSIVNGVHMNPELLASDTKHPNRTIDPAAAVTE
jgi:hypothetical protein